MNSFALVENKLSALKLFQLLKGDSLFCSMSGRVSKLVTQYLKTINNDLKT